MLYFQVPASRFHPSCGSGGTGRRASLRSLFSQESGGSNPLFRTNLRSARSVSELRLARRSFRRMTAPVSTGHFGCALPTANRWQSPSGLFRLLNSHASPSQLFGHHRNCDGHQNNAQRNNCYASHSIAGHSPARQARTNTHRLAPVGIRSYGPRRIGPPPIKPQDPVDSVNRSPSKRSCISAYAMTARTMAARRH